MRFLLAVILMCLCAAAAQAEEAAPALAEVTSCGRTFLELEGQAATGLTWAGYGEAFDTLWGVPAYSNGTKVRAACYQCTEAVHRFVRHMYGVESYYCGVPVMGNARYVARNLDGYFGWQTRSTARIAPYKIRLENFFNGATACRPVTGAVVSLEINFSEDPCDAKTGKGGACATQTKASAYDGANGAGHVAIIRSLRAQADGSLEGDLFAQHGRMYSTREKNRGAPIAPGRIRFKQDEEGTWRGWWWTPTPDGTFHTRPMPVISWTNPVIVARDATEDDLTELPVETACVDVARTSSWAKGCEQIRAGRKLSAD